MKKRYAALGSLSRALDMPLEYAAGLPKVELEGFTAARVESHRGLLEYSSEKIILAASGARVQILGERLNLKTLSPRLAVITGRIHGAAYLPGEGEP